MGGQLYSNCPCSKQSTGGLQWSQTTCFEHRERCNNEHMEELLRELLRAELLKLLPPFRRLTPRQSHDAKVLLVKIRCNDWFVVGIVHLHYPAFNDGIWQIHFHHVAKIQRKSCTCFVGMIFQANVAKTQGKQERTD